MGKQRKIEPMTPAELQRSHHAMALFLVEVLRFSDREANKGKRRYPPAEKQYQKALKLVRAAGYNYEPTESSKP